MSMDSVNLYRRGRLCTVDLLIKIACFVNTKNTFSILKASGIK
jgi:hypothetical protein